MAAVYIYALLDPRSNEVRYVGKTNNPVKRKNNHSSPSQAELHGRAKNKWVIELREIGLRPEFKILEECDENNWNERERFWIAHYGGIRKLLNARLGGEIVPPASAETYKLLADKTRGIPRTPEVVEKLRNAWQTIRKGYRHSEETIKKIRKANGRQFSDPICKERHRDLMKSWWDGLSKEQKQKSLDGAAKGRLNASAAARAGSKKFWESMTLEQKKNFCEERAKKQAALRRV
jgi:GIY-YIG catalytic domain